MCPLRQSHQGLAIIQDLVSPATIDRTVTGALRSLQEACPLPQVLPGASRVSPRNVVRPLATMHRTGCHLACSTNTQHAVSFPASMLLT